MGDYSNVEVRFAESDFDPEEREFMAQLRDRYFEPARSLQGQPDSFQGREALREQVHADMRLPGTASDWRFILHEEIDGRHYYLPLNSLSPAIIPPFPQKMAKVYRLREKYGIRPIWYAMFAPGDWQDDRLRLITTIGQARKQFAANLDAVWGLLFPGEDELEALMAAAPEGSDARKCLAKVFDRFPLANYLSVLKFLAEDWGGEALIELNYYEVAHCFSPPDEYRAAIQAEFESTLRVLDALRQLDVASLPGEVFFASNRSYNGSGIAPWLAPYLHHEAVRRFQRWFIPDVYEW
jgi:hypothetical protein